jgi:hypothetical protein
VKGYKTINKNRKKRMKEGREEKKRNTKKAAAATAAARPQVRKNSGPCHLRIIRAALTSQPPPTHIHTREIEKEKEKKIHPPNCM